MMNRHVIMWSTIGIAILALAVGAAWFTLETDVWWEPVFRLVALVIAGMATLYGFARVVVLRNESGSVRIVASLTMAVLTTAYGAKLLYEPSYQQSENLLTGAFLVGITVGAVLALKSLHGYLKRNERTNGEHLREVA